MSHVGNRNVHCRYFYEFHVYFKTVVVIQIRKMSQLITCQNDPCHVGYVDSKLSYRGDFNRKMQFT